MCNKGGKDICSRCGAETLSSLNLRCNVKNCTVDHWAEYKKETRDSGDDDVGCMQCLD